MLHRTSLLAVAALLTGACAGLGQSDPIIDTVGVDPEQYAQDLAECEALAEQVDVAEQAGLEAGLGAATYGLIGAILGDSSTAGKSAASGAVLGGSRGAVRGTREKNRVVKKCLANRGYAVLN